MKQVLFIVMFFVFVSEAKPQALKFTFQVDHEKKGIARSTNLIANGEGIITDYSGNFQLTLNPSINNIRVQSPDELKYIVKYPKDGIILLPRNTTDVIRIVIDEPDKDQVSGQIKKQIAGSLSKLESRLKKMEKEDEKLRQTILSSMDSLLREAQKNNITEAELRSAKEIIEGKDKYFPEISSMLLNYVNEVRDLNDGYKFVARNALRNLEARKRLAADIDSYNLIYEQLNAKKAEYEQAIRNFWQSNELAYNFLNVTEYAIGDIHRSNVLSFSSLIDKINEYNSTKTTRRDQKKLEKEINSEFSRLVPDLDRKLNVLSEKVSALISMLKSFNG